MRTHTNLESLSNWVFALTLVGYPIFGLLAALINVESKLLTYPFRFGIVILSLVLYLKSRGFRPSYKKESLLLFFLLSLYLLRLIWDTFVTSVPGAMNALIFFLFSVLTPCIALARAQPANNECHLLFLSAFIGGSACLLAVLMHCFNLGQEQSLIAQTNRLSFTALNPISLGHTAVTTIIATLCLKKYRLSLSFHMVIILLACTAVVCLFLANSRGPVLAFFVCITVAIFFTKERKTRIASGILLLFFFTINLFSEYSGNRFLNIQDTQSDMERVALIKNSIPDVVQSPVFGSSFVNSVTFGYPHNIFIDAAMSLGVVGLVIMILVMMTSGFRALRTLRQGSLLMPLLFLQYFIHAQISGTIWGISGLWSIVILLSCRDGLDIKFYPLYESQKNKSITTG